MAPSVTEILFALGLGDRVVGVTRYCDHPLEARTRSQVGGFLDPNYEAVLALQPDLVLVYPEHLQPRDRFQELGLRTLVLPHWSLPDVFQSIEQVGQACGAVEPAQKLVASMQARLSALQAQNQGRTVPRVLICLDRVYGTGSLQDVYIVGPQGYFNELLQAAGGRNAYLGAPLAYPRISGEGILQLDPDVIVDLLPQDLAINDFERLKSDWKSLPLLRAVREDRVYVLRQNAMMRPGPRLPDCAEELSRLLQSTSEPARP